MRGIVHLLREFSSSYFFVPGACDRPISCWEPTNQTFMAAAWATCSLAQNYLWLVLPRKTWHALKSVQGPGMFFEVSMNLVFVSTSGCHGFSTCEFPSMRNKCQSVEIFQCDGHRRIACPHAIGLASADRTARHQRTVGMPGQWCASDKDERKSKKKRPRTQNWHWDWMTLASWDFGSIFLEFFLKYANIHVFCITHQG